MHWLPRLYFKISCQCFDGAGGLWYQAQYSVVPLWCNQFSPKLPQKITHSSPIRVRYGVSFVCANSDLYSVSVTAVAGAISRNIGSRYNDTLLNKYVSGPTTVCVFTTHHQWYIDDHCFVQFGLLPVLIYHQYVFNKCTNARLQLSLMV